MTDPKCDKERMRNMTDQEWDEETEEETDDRQ